MLEVSQRLVDLAVRQFDAGGLNTTDLTAGLRSIASSGHFIDWNDLATLFERAEEAVGGPSRIADLSGGAAVSALPEGRALMALAPDALLGARLINKLADATFFTNVRYPSMRQTGERTLTLSLRLDRRRGQRDCPAFLRAMEGTLRASSEFAGLPPATVKAQIGPFLAHYVVTLPRFPAAAGAAPGEAAVKTAFLRECELALGHARQGMLELRATDLRAREAETFVELSGAVARALKAQEREVFPKAAALAIQQVFGCQRVVLRRLPRSGGGSPRVLAAAGVPVRSVHVVETETLSGSLRIEADIARDSPAGRALERLAPWLVMICAEGTPAAADARASGSDWAEERLANLAELWGLTPRQQQVMWLVVSGQSNKGIANALHCAEGTVELHVHAVLKKSGTDGRTALTARFFRAP